MIMRKILLWVTCILFATNHFGKTNFILAIGCVINRKSRQKDILFRSNYTKLKKSRLGFPIVHFCFLGQLLLILPYQIRGLYQNQKEYPHIFLRTKYGKYI